MAFCNKRDNRSYAQALSSPCDSPFHNTDKWSPSTASSHYMDSTAASGGQYPNKTHQFGGSKRGVLYKEGKQVCWCHIKPDPACQVCAIVLKNGQGSSDSMDLKGPLQPKNYFLSISTSKHIIPNPVDKYTHKHWESHKKCFCLAFLQKSASQNI